MLHLSPFLTTYCTVLAFVLGTVLASFLGCLGWRICKGESVLRGRSHCDTCNHVLGALDLVPIFSYLFHKGRCRYCGAKIPPINLVGEMIMGVLFALLILTCDSFSFELLLWMFFFCILYLVTVTDIYEQIIPDGAIITAIVVKVFFVIICHFFDFSQNIIYLEKTSLWEKLVGLLIDGLSISLPLLILVIIMEKIMKKDAMGGGDIKLLFVTGLYLGWMNNILVMFIACIIGIIIGTIQQRNAQSEAGSKESDSEEEPFYFPFGPSIALSAVFVLFFGNQILDWYLSLF